MVRRLLAVIFGLTLLLAALPAAATPAPSIAWQWLDPSPQTDPPVPWASVASDGTRFLAATGGALAASADGLAWAPVETAGHPVEVFYRNGQWLAGASTGNGRELATSADGRTWKRQADLGISVDVTSIAYGHGRYVLGMVNSPPRVFTADFQPVALTQAMGFVGAASNVAFGKGLFVGAAGGRILFSQDGLSWSDATLMQALPEGRQDVSPFTGVTYGNGRFVAVAGVGGGGVLYTSADGHTWTRTAEAPSDLKGVIFGGGWFLAWGDDDILTSRDGTTWTSAPNRAARATFAYGGGRFIAVNPSGTVMTAMICGAPFPDLPAGHPACEAAEALADLGILSGYADGTFRPDAPVTRAEMAKMLVLTLGLKPTPGSPFTDTAGHWAARDGYLQPAVAAGIFNGTPDGRFWPDAPVTRAQLTKVAAAAAGLQPAESAGPEWSAGWVAAARQADLIGAGAYHPLWAGEDFLGDTPATRAEAAILLDNLRNH